MTSHRDADGPTPPGSYSPSLKKRSATASPLKRDTEPASGRPSQSGQLSPIATWLPKRLDPGTFPDRLEGKPPATVANIAYLLEQNGITARYNVIKKKLEIRIPDMSLTADKDRKSVV